MYNRSVKNRLKILNRLWKNEKYVRSPWEDFFLLTLYICCSCVKLAVTVHTYLCRLSELSLQRWSDLKWLLFWWVLTTSGAAQASKHVQMSFYKIKPNSHKVMLPLSLCDGWLCGCCLIHWVLPVHCKLLSSCLLAPSTTPDVTLHHLITCPHWLDRT